MKKKVMSLLLVAAMTASMLAGCGSAPEEKTENTGETAPAGTEAAAEDAAAPEESTGTNELALCIDVGTIDDKSFNQGSWEGIERYAQENGISAKYYKSADVSTDAFIDTIELAIEGGAKTIVCPGFLFEVPIYTVQSQYPDVHFILVDGVPNDGGQPATTEIAANTMPVLYQEDEAGFLAGYAAVKDGYTKLGFMGGMALPAVVRYGYGFVAGANYAAGEMGVEGVEVTYYYTGAFEATPEAQTMAASWYQAGTEVIFACGGAVGNSVMAAAEAQEGKKVIGVDVDQSSESDTVITSAMKELSNSVYDAVSAVYAGTFKGGEIATFNAANNGVGLPMATSKFTTFTQEDYDAIFAKLVAGEIEIENDYEKALSDIVLENITVNEVQ